MFAAGDRIKVVLNPDVWKLLQEDHGGWNDLMSVVSQLINARRACARDLLWSVCLCVCVCVCLSVDLLPLSR